MNEISTTFLVILFALVCACLGGSIGYLVGSSHKESILSEQMLKTNHCPFEIIDTKSVKLRKP